MDTKGPINPPSEHKSYIHVIVDAFSHFIVTVPIKSNNAKTAVKTLSDHWITKFGPPIYLVTGRGSENINKDMAHLCTLMGIRHSPRTASSLWTNGLGKNKREILEPTYACSFTTLLKTGHSKFTCMLMQTNLNLFQNSMSLIMK